MILRSILLLSVLLTALPAQAERLRIVVGGPRNNFV